MTTEGDTAAPQSEDEDKRRRRPIAWWWWAVGGGALIAAILVVVMLAGDDADDQAAPNERVQAPTPGATNTSGGSTATEAPTASDSSGTASDPDADAPDIEGVWEFIVNVTETSGVCAGEEDESPGIDNVTIRRLDDGSYSVSGLGTTPDSEWTGRWDGDKFVFSGEREEDGGTTVAEFTMTFEDSVFAGIEDWSWSDADGECPTGKSEVEAFFYSPLP
jgi:hypothetical protein